MSIYAPNTTVSEEKSRVEIEQTLKKYGADQFVYGSDQEMAFILFRMNEKQVRFIVKYPKFDDFKFTPTRQRRSPDSQKSAWEQAKRSSWRVLLLVIKAKLEAVESKIVSFEEEFMANIMLPNRLTVGEYLLPQIEQAYIDGKMPPLLPMFGGNHNG